MEASNQSTLQAVQWGALLRGFHHDARYLHGYVSTEAEVDTVLELYRRVTAAAFCVRTSSPLTFDPRRADMRRFSTRSFQFSKASNPQMGAEGAPFTHGGKRILECQYGPRREHERKRGGAAPDPAPGLPPGNSPDPAPGLPPGNSPDPAPRPGRVRSQRQETRKKGCAAKITVLQICMLPDYAVSGRKMVKVLQINAKERLLEDLCLGRPVRVENRYYVDLPLPNAHSNHGPAPAPAPALHPRVAGWLGLLVAEGVTEPAEVQAALRQRVQTSMSDVAAPSELDRAYYPRLADVRGHVSRARARLAKLARTKKPCEEPPPPEVHHVAMETASYTIIDIKAGEPFSLACEDHVADDIGEDGDHGDGAASPSDQEGCLDNQEGCLDDQDGCLDDQEDTCSGTPARKKGRGRAKASLRRTRKKAHEELEVLRTMTRGCTHGPALEALTQSIRALQHSFTQLVEDASAGGGAGEGPPQAPAPAGQQHRKRKHAAAPLPLSKASSAKGRGGHVPRKRSGKADVAKMAAPQTS